MSASIWRRNGYREILEFIVCVLSILPLERFGYLPASNPSTAQLYFALLIQAASETCCTAALPAKLEFPFCPQNWNSHFDPKTC
jgi:hypothetical protein